MTKAESLARVLDEFLGDTGQVEAAAVVSTDGLPMASALPPHVEEDRLAAMSAALLTLGERAASGLGKGGLAQVFVEGEFGYVVLMAAGSQAVLVAVTSHEAKAGLVIFEMRKTAERVADIMSGSAEQARPQAELNGGTEQPEPPAMPEAPKTETPSVISSWQ